MPPGEDMTPPLVFLGPSLPIEEARRLLPGARICPPVRCGDLLALLRLRRPRAFVIIDGQFESTAAVWHKEILYALARGCPVYGASSMGALRAAELAELGMRGVGRIYEGLRAGTLIDDGEVAVLHAPQEQGYAPLSDALVNVRATLAAAVSAGVLGEAAAAALLDKAAATFYQRRVLVDLVAEGGVTGGEDETRRLLAWLKARGVVDQKRADAVELLSLLRDEPAPAPAPPPSAPRLDEVLSAPLRNLLCHVACRPLPFHAPWLPASERVASAARLWGPRYGVLRDLALALCFLDAGARAQGNTLDASLARAEGKEGALLPHLLRHYNLPQDPGPLSRRELGWLARALHALDEVLAARGLSFACEDDEILEHAATLQRARGITGKGEREAWLRAAGIGSMAEYADFLRFSLRLGKVLCPYALYQHGCFQIDADRPWLTEALRRCGAYDELAAQLQGPDFAREAAARWRGLPAPARALLLTECDLRGEAELQRLLRALEMEMERPGADPDDDDAGEPEPGHGPGAAA